MEVTNRKIAKKIYSLHRISSFVLYGYTGIIKYINIINYK